MLRIGVLLVAVFSIAVGVLGLVSPATLTAIRRVYFAAPASIYTALALRLFMALVVILGATRSRAPRFLRVLGALMAMQVVSGTLLGPDHAREVMEWEAAHTTLLRIGAAVSLAAGVFMAFAAPALPRQA